MTQITKEAISRAIRDPGVTEGYKGDRTRSEWQTDAVMRVLSTLPIAGEGKVKALEWGTERPIYGEGAAFDAYCSIGRYIATDTGWFLLGQTQYQVADGIEASKAAAQADYETRILSALISSPGKDGGQEVETCPVCAEPLNVGDLCATDIELGTCHAACLEGSPVVDLETGEPSDGPINTFPFETDSPQPASTALVEKASAFDQIVAARKAHVDAVSAYNARLEFVRAERMRGSWLSVDKEYAASTEAERSYLRITRELADAAAKEADHG